MESALYLSGKFYVTKTHFSCCQDSTAYSLDEGEHGCVFGGDKSACIVSNQGHKSRTHQC